MNNKTVSSLFLLSYVVLIGAAISVSIGIYIDELSLIIAGLGLIGSFVGMYNSALSSKRNLDQDRPYIVLKTNENRYGHLQLEFSNAGNNAAIIEDIELNNEITLLKGEKIKEILNNLVIQGKGDVSYPYIVLGNGESINKFINIEGVIHYKDLLGNRFNNKIALHLEHLKITLMYKREDLKRDYEIIQMSKSIQSIDKQLNKLL